MRNDKNIEVCDPRIEAILRRDSAIRALRDNPFMWGRDTDGRTLLASTDALSNRGARGRELGLMMAAMVVDPASEPMRQIAAQLHKDSRGMRRPAVRLQRLLVIGGLSEPFDALRGEVVQDAARLFARVARADPTTAAHILSSASHGLGPMDGRKFRMQLGAAIRIPLTRETLLSPPYNLAQTVARLYPPPHSRSTLPLQPK